MNTLQVTGILAIAFGVLILALPHLLNTLVAIFFIIVGINLLMWQRRLK